MVFFQDTTLADITLWFIGIGTIVTMAQRYSATKRELC